MTESFTKTDNNENNLFAKNIPSLQKVWGKRVFMVNEATGPSLTAFTMNSILTQNIENCVPRTNVYIFQYLSPEPKPV